jgi:hypothetical protein
MGGTQATITAMTTVITILLSLAILAVPKRHMLLPLVVAACWVPADQRIVIWGLDFHVLQILVLAAMARLWATGEVVRVRWNRLDHLVLAWAVVQTIAYVSLWMEMRALIYMSGRLLEWLGLYWVFRQTVGSWKDVRFAYIVLAICALAMTPFVALEWTTGANPFRVLGRVATFIREGNFRCQATFPHAIMMGLFWATLVPLFVGFAKQQKRHAWLFWGAVAASTFMIFGTTSSTPLLTLAAVAVLLLAFPWRQQTRMAAWGCVATLVALQFIMKAPVWHLLARVGVVSGSTGWHRYYLVNQAIKYFPEWMLHGTKDTSHWGGGLEDVTNQFILEGVRGGFVTLVLFCIILFIGARAMVRLSLRSQEKGEAYLAWCVFVTIIAHCVSFFGVSYFGQISMPWYLLLAVAGHFYGEVYAKPNLARRGVKLPELEQVH